MIRMNLDNNVIIARTEMFNSFMESISQYKPYKSREEERDAFLAFQNEADETKKLALKQEILLRNMRAMVSVASRFSHNDVVILDMVDSMVEMMYHAIESFNPNMGFKFLSYAIEYMVESCRRCAYGMSTIAVPRHKSYLWDKVKRASRILTQRNSYAPTSKEIADFCYSEYGIEVDPKEVLALSIASIDITISDNEGEEISVAEVGELAKKFSVKQESHEKKDFLTSLNVLPKREREIVIAYFGLKDGFEKTSEALAEEQGCSEEEIRIILRKALKTLRGSKGMRIYAEIFAE